MSCRRSCASKGIGRQGIGSFREQFHYFNTVEHYEYMALAKKTSVLCEAMLLFVEPRSTQ